MSDGGNGPGFSKEQLDNANARYTPFPGFGDWNSIRPDRERWNQAVQNLERRKSEASAEILEASLKSALRAAAVDSGAIEGLYETDRGFTFTVATQLEAWRAVADEKGDKVGDLIEAQIKAYEMAVDIANQRQPISETWIRQVHEVATAPQKTYRVFTDVGWQERPMPKGQYKEDPNHPWSADGELLHAYAPVQDTKPEMQRMVSEIQSSQFLDAHPVLQASYAHYSFVAIHPFADGNGRVARILASVYFFRALSIPFLVYNDQKPDYLAALKQADEGQIGAFGSFVQARGIETMLIVTDDLRTRLLPEPEPVVAELGQLAVSRGGLTHSELDDAIRNLYDAMVASLKRTLSEMDLPSNLQAQVSLTANNWSPDLEGYRNSVANPRLALVLSLQSEPPGNASVSRVFRVQVATPSTHGADLIIAGNKQDDLVEFQVEAAYPNVTTATDQRLASWAEGAVREALPELHEKVQSQLRSSGYLDES